MDKPKFDVFVLATITILISSIAFIELLDATIINVSIPAISGSFGISLSEGTAAIVAYSLGAALVMPLTGRLAQRTGEVKLFCASSMLFTVCSLLCALSTTIDALILFRFLQGLVSGPLVPLSLSLLIMIFPQESKPTAIAFWSASIGIAPIIGPVLGGWITDYYQWPILFLINLPLGIFASVYLWLKLKDYETKTEKVPIDYIGMILLFIGVGALQVFLEFGPEDDWFESNFITTCLVVAVVCLSYMVLWVTHRNNPIILLSLFRDRNFAVGVTIQSLVVFASVGITVVYPLWLQGTLNYTATWAGLALAPVGILMLIFSFLIGKALKAVDGRWLCAVGLLIFFATSAWFSLFPTTVSFESLFLPRLLLGLGVAFFFVPINNIILSTIPPSSTTAALGLSNFLRTLAASMGAAVTVTLWRHRDKYHEFTLTQNVQHESNYESLLSELSPTDLNQPALSLQMVKELVADESATLAVNDIYALYALIFLLMLALLAFTRRAPQAA